MSKLSTARFGELLEVMSEEEQKAFEERAFRAWMKKVDAVTLGACSLSTEDLPDISYRDHFEDGMSPREVAAIALAEAGADEELMEDFDL